MYPVAALCASREDGKGRATVIRAIVFDFGQTLVDSADGFRTAEKEAQGKALCGPRPRRPGGIPSGLPRRSVPLFTPAPIFPGRAILEGVFRHYGRDPDPLLLEQWETDYWQRIKAMTRVFPEAEEVLRTTPGGAVPPGPDHQRPGADRRRGSTASSNYPELERLFEVIVVAGEGASRRNRIPLPFRLCLDKIGDRPRRAVYVGDDWRIDVRGAEAVGMHPVWLKHRLVRRNWPAGRDRGAGHRQLGAPARYRRTAEEGEEMTTRVSGWRHPAAHLR